MARRQIERLREQSIIESELSDRVCEAIDAERARRLGVKQKPPEAP